MTAEQRRYMLKMLFLQPHQVSRTFIQLTLCYQQEEINFFARNITTRVSFFRSTLPSQFILPFVPPPP
jgi:hypothetical protein